MTKPTGIIVIDGPDGSGKSTLAQRLVEQYDAEYLHLTYRWPNNMFDYHTAAIHWAGKRSKDRLVVIDRWWMSELCYANAYRNGSKWPLMYRMLDRIALKYGCIYVYSLPENIRDHLNAYEGLKLTREEMYKDISPVVIEYHKLWDKVKTWPHVRRYDYQKHALQGCGENTVDAYAAALVADLQAWRAEQVDIALDPANYNLTGHISPAKYLLVGDKTNPRKRHGKWWPFHDYAASSLHLAQTLERLGVPEYECLYTNYNNSKAETDYLMRNFDLRMIVFGSAVFDPLVRDFGGGSKAWKILANPQNVVHPAYDLRFRHGKTLACDLGSAVLRSEAYGRFPT